MRVVTFADLQDNLEKHLDRVEEDRDVLIVPRDKGEAMVFVALSEWNRMQEMIRIADAGT